MIRLVAIIILFLIMAFIKAANPTNLSVVFPLLIFVWIPILLIMAGILASYFIHPPGRKDK